VGRHPSPNGGFALGSKHCRDFQRVRYRNIEIRGSVYNGPRLVSVSRPVQLNNRKAQFTLWYDRDKTHDNLKQVLDSLCRALVLMEEIVGVDFPSYFEPEYTIDTPTDATVRENGNFMTVIEPKLDPVTLHEMAHWWSFQHVFVQKGLVAIGWGTRGWIQHGWVNLISNLVMAALENKRLYPIFLGESLWIHELAGDMAFHEHDKMREEVGFWALFDDEVGHLIEYSKSTMFFITVYQIIGLEALQRMNRYLHETDTYLSKDNIIVLFEKFSEKNLSFLESGWISEGPYSRGWRLYDIYADSDFDGLKDIEENAYGTDSASMDTDDDGYSDRWELDAGYDPLKPGSPGNPALTAVDGVLGDFFPVERILSVRNRILRMTERRNRVLT
jgi:hypothetical protein